MSRVTDAEDEIKAIAWNDLVKAKTRETQLRAMLERFMDFQISDYDRVATRAQDYCAIRRDARKLLQSFEINQEVSRK